MPLVAAFPVVAIVIATASPLCFSYAGGGSEGERERSFFDNQEVTAGRYAQRPVG